jgi:flagellar motor switch protein FliN
MNPNSPSNIAPELLDSLCTEISAAAAAVLSQVAGAELQASATAVEDAAQAATRLQLTLSGAIEGQCELNLDGLMSSRFAGLLMGEAPVPDAEVTQDTREAAAELLGQICGNAADRLRKQHGPLEMKSQPVGIEQGGAGDDAAGQRHRIAITGGAEELAIELHALALTAPQPEEAAAQPDATPPPPPANAMPAFSTGSRNLDLLLEIELGASLRFGTRQMLLKDILELCSGSVVELDRKVQEPVELLIDGRVIAQGEVVIVDGNYGLRILQVSSPGEKIACLAQAR